MTTKLFTHIATVAWMLLTLLGFSTLLSAEAVRLYFDPATPQIAFAAGDIKAALEKQNHTVQTADLSTLANSDTGKKIVLALATDTAAISILNAQGGSPLPSLGTQAYALRTTTTPALSYWATGGDATGAMYGGLQIAENISVSGIIGTFNSQETPFLLNRGMKLNLPLDKRIPTYVGGWSSHSAREAIPHVWDMTFWKTLIDQQARSRYNILSIWVHHPFPALVSVPDYPNATLPNIQKYDGTLINLNHTQRVTFWRDVMKHAHDRGMKFYFFNWNIYVDYAKDQYPALTQSPTNLATIDYYSKSMRALLETYPELDGFGITSGDGMDGTADENTKWTWDAMGKAVHDYLTANPSRNFNLIHRGVKTDPETCNSIYAPLKAVPNATFNMSAKYAMAHMYSTPTPRWTGDIQSCANLGLKTWLTFRNDDYFYLNWGDPKFVRDFMYGIPLKDSVVGMYIGIDGYNPSRSYCHKNESLNGQLEVERRWYMEMLWGRISYNPATSDDVFRNLLATRYPTVSSGDLFDAWTLASRSLPKVTELIMKDWNLDFHWYPEGCWSDPGRCSGFRTINDVAGATGGFAGQDVANGSNFCSIANSAAGNLNGRKSSYVVADEMQADSARALALIETMQSGGNADLEVAINNVKQMAYLGIYYAHKVRGATYKKAGQTVNARTEMGKAYCRWIAYSRSMESSYHPDSFRNLSIAPDWKYADAAVLKEYADLGGVGIPDCEDLFTLTTTATHGSMALEPSGGVYAAGTVVTVTATPNYGYAFATWGGDLSGAASPMTITMDGKKNVTANFVANVSGDVAPWIETFAMADGTKEHGAPTSWLATRSSGKFEVSGNRLMINGGSGGTSVEGVFETADINIPAGSVKVSLDVQSVGVDSSDYVRFYKMVDGGAPVQINAGNITGSTTYTESNITGSKLKLRITTRVSAADEYYFLDNLKVGYEAPLPTYTLTTGATNGSVSLNPPPSGGVYTAGTVVTVTATPNSGYAFSDWSGDLTGSLNPTSITMSGNRSVTANFIVVPPGNKNVLFVVGDANNVGPSDLMVRNRLQDGGYTVQLISDELAAAANATGKGLVITSSTVSSGALNSNFRDVIVPVINWEASVQDDYGFTAAANLGTGASATLNITDAGHPLAAGLPAGIRTVATTTGAFSWGEPGGSPIIIARLNDGSNHPCIYAYETHAAMAVGTAPSRRVQLFLQNDTFASLNADGLKLFDAAVDWAMGQTAPGWVEVTVLEGGIMRLEWVGGGTLQTSTTLQEPWTDLPGAVSPYLHPITNPAQFFRVKK